MDNFDQPTDRPMSFYERYSGFSDQQIKEILKNHKNYQEPAVNAAVKIAIERELIHNEQDLLGPEYQYKASENWSLFPEIPITWQYKKLMASIFRVLFIAAFIPIIFGLLKYAEGQLNMTFLGVGIGLGWATLTFILLKTKRLIVLYLQVIMLILSSIFLSYRILSTQFYKGTDILMLVIGTLIILYFLFYLRKLIQTKPE